MGPGTGINRALEHDPSNGDWVVRKSSGSVYTPLFHQNNTNKIIIIIM